MPYKNLNSVAAKASQKRRRERFRMEKTYRICDREGCGKDNATSLTLFKERKADGAGGMEDWFYIFDLCPTCAVSILDAIFSTLRRDTLTEEKAVKFLKDRRIKMREV